MFAFLPVSAASGSEKSWPSRLLSIALHAVVIAVAVGFSGAVEAPGQWVPQIVDIALPPAPQPNDAPPSAPVIHHVGAPPTITFDPRIPPVIPPPGLPIGVPVIGADPLPGTWDSIRLPLIPGTPVIGTTPIDARVADESPRLLDHPPVRYPEIMRQAGIEARVMIEAVLDTTGRAELSSLRVVTSGGAAFDEEARAVVAGSRYSAARLAGRAVRVRIQVPVSFALRP